MVEAPNKRLDRARAELDTYGRVGKQTASDLILALFEAERQIAELRAELKTLRAELGGQNAEAAVADWRALKDRAQAAEAENARLRALPLKDEVERVLEPFAAVADRLSSNWQDHETHWAERAGDIDVGELRAARSLLSRIREGKQEGWKLVPADPDLAEHLIRAALVAGYKGVGSTDEEAETLADAKMADPKELAFSKAQYAGMLAAAPSEQGGDRS